MSRQPDQILLHYRLIEKIGEGGMGVVWRARDTSLDRDVAVKILPDAVARHHERLARFEREAKAVAALAHPNILTVYDFGREGETAYMVTELLEGRSLRGLLADGPLPPSKAAELARQVARGLDAAHRKGFVHRDLKPENVFVTREGRAKVLDFGLASISAPGRGTDRVSTHTPTETELTSPGSVMGTVDYMSPEQVRGESVDHRSDLYSFGTLLFEMLTATRPFRRDTVPETMTAILREDPPSSGGESGVEIPPALERVVRRCLEKQPEERFQSASDLAFAVDNALGATSSVTAAEPAVRASGSKVGGRLMMFVAAVALLAIGLLAGRVSGPPPSPEPSYTQLTFREGRISTARFATDDRTITYSAGWEGEGLRLYTVHEGSPESRALDVEDVEVLSISSKGELALLLRPRYILGWTIRGTLARMPLGGGAPREMQDNISSADWDPSGEQLAVVRMDGSASRLEYPPGNVIYQTKGWIAGVRFSADGQRIAFADHPSIGDNRGVVAVTDLAGNVRRLGPTWSSFAGLAWSARGDEIWFTAGDRGRIRPLRAVGMDGKLRIVTSAPATFKLHDIDAGGRVLISRNTSSRRIVGRPPGATEEVPLSWLDWSFPGAISSDGETVLFTEQGEGGGPGYSTYLRTTRGDPAIRLGTGQGLDLYPDGSRVLSGLVGEGWAALQIYPTGAGDSRRIEVPDVDPNGAYWTGRADEMLLIGSLRGAPQQVLLYDPAAGKLDPVTPQDIDYLSVCLHRKLRLVTARVVDGPLQLYSLAGDEPRTLPGIGTSQAVAGWSDDGWFLFLVDRDRLPQPVVRYDVKTGKTEPVLELMPAEPAGLIDIGPVYITPDGRAYLYSYRRYLSTLYVGAGFS